MLRAPVKIKTLRTKLVFNSYLATIIILFFTISIYSHYFDKEMDTRFRSRVLAVAKTASLMIDIEDFNSLKTRNDEKTEQYYHIRKKLQDIKKANPQILFIYTLRPTAEKNIYEFVVDADKKPYHIGDKYDVAGQDIIKKGLKFPITENDYENNRWGKYLTAYAPIMDVDGKTVGLVGVDFAVSTPEEPESRGLTSANLITILVALAINSYFSLRKTSFILKPLAQIREALDVMSKGNFDYKVNVESGDELAAMASSLNNLSETVNELNKKAENEYKITEENSKKVLNVYSDVIYSMTRGKIELVSEEDATPLALEGVLYTEANLENPEDVKKTENLTRQLFKEKEFDPDEIGKAAQSVTAAANNAVKHAGGASFQLRLLDGYIRAIISDKGPGIEFSHLPTILFLRNGSPEKMASEPDTGFPVIIANTDRISLATSENGTHLILDFELKKQLEVVSQKR